MLFGPSAVRWLGTFNYNYSRSVHTVWLTFTTLPQKWLQIRAGFQQVIPEIEPCENNCRKKLHFLGSVVVWSIISQWSWLDVKLG